MNDQEESTKDQRAVKIGKFLCFISDFIVKHKINLIFCTVLIVLSGIIWTISTDIQETTDLSNALKEAIEKSESESNVIKSALEVKHISERLDTMMEHQSNMLTWIGIIAGIVVAGGGILSPLLINRGYEKKFDKQEIETAKQLSNFASDIEEIKVVRDEVKILQTSVIEKEKQAEYAAKNAEISRTTSEAAKENDQLHAVALYQKALASIDSLLENIDDDDKRYNSLMLLKFSTLVNIGVAYGRLDNNRKAIVYFEQAIEIDNSDTRVWENKAITNRKLELYDEAINDYKMILKLTPYDSRAMRIIGDIHAENNNIQEAVKYYDLAKSNSIDSPVTLNNYGITLMNAQRYDEAIKQFKLSTEIFPDDSEAYYNLGILYQENTYIKNETLAIDYFNTSLLKDKLSYKAFLHRGLSKVSTDDLIGGLADYNMAILIDPQNSLAYINRGSALFQCEEYLASINDYNMALNIDPMNVAAFFNRGNAYSAIDMNDLALKDYNTALEISHDLFPVYLLRGQLYAKLNDKANAEFDFSHALKLAPHMRESILMTSALAYKSMKEYDAALSDLDELLIIQPNNVDYKNKRCEVLYKLGRYAEAVSDYAKIIKIDNGTIDTDLNTVSLVKALTIIGKLHFKQELFIKALKYFDLATATGKSDLEIYNLKYQSVEHILKTASDDQKEIFEKRLLEEKSNLQILNLLNK